MYRGSTIKGSIARANTNLFQQLQNPTAALQSSIANKKHLLATTICIIIRLGIFQPHSSMCHMKQYKDFVQYKKNADCRGGLSPVILYCAGFISALIAQSEYNDQHLPYLPGGIHIGYLRNLRATYLYRPFTVSYCTYWRSHFSGLSRGSQDFFCSHFMVIERNMGYNNTA